MTLPSVPATFYWTDESWGAGLRCRPLEVVAAHLFTTRQLQLTSADERRVAEAVGARSLLMAKQVHGSHAIVLKQGASLPPGVPEGDALVSNMPEVAVAVRVADCVPLLIADRRSGAVAAVHAGWRGTAARIVVAAVDALRREFGCRPIDLVVAIGPCIRSCCYEVGTELVDAFAAAGHERHVIDRWFLAPPAPRGTRERPKLRLDLETANRDQLILAGALEENIYTAGLCTAMHLDVLTSYRVEKTEAGRLMGVIRASR